MSHLFSIPIWKPLRWTPCWVVGGLYALLAPITSAVQAPFHEDFDSYSTGATPGDFASGFTGPGTSAFSTWDVQNQGGAGGVYRNALGGWNTQSAAVLSVTNLQQVDFTLTTTFVINAYSGGISNVTDIRAGLSALGTGVNSPSSGYQLSYSVLYLGPSLASGALTLNEGGNPMTFGYSGTVPVVTGVTYTMTLTGTYIGSGLQLLGTLSDGNVTLSTTVLDSTPQAGSYFGYYNLAQGSVNRSASMNVSYDNFGISIPEPRSIYLLLSVLVLVPFLAGPRSLMRRLLSRG